MDSDKFVSTSKNTNNLFVNEDNDNFFLQADGGVMHISQAEPTRHLNDYDSNILQDGAYRDVTDEVLKLEYKITRAENAINELNKQIQLAEEINDSYLANTLYTKKLQWENDLQDLSNQYKNLSISAKISGGFSSKIRDRFVNTRNFIGMIGESLLSKLPGKFSSILEIKNSLNTLANINKSVDELMAVQYPYGEASDKYEQLSKYIARANTIQAEISKFMK